MKLVYQVPSKEFKDAVLALIESWKQSWKLAEHGIIFLKNVQHWVAAAGKVDQNLPPSVKAIDLQPSSCEGLADDVVSPRDIVLSEMECSDLAAAHQKLNALLWHHRAPIWAQIVSNSCQQTNTTLILNQISTLADAMENYFSHMNTSETQRAAFSDAVELNRACRIKVEKAIRKKNPHKALQLVKDSNFLKVAEILEACVVQDTQTS